MAGKRRSRAHAPPDSGASTPTRPPPIGGSYRPLDATAEAAIIDHAFEILATVGMAGATGETGALLLEAGATHREDGRLLLDRSVVEAALATGPSTVDIPGFVEDRGLTIGDRRVHIGTGGAAVQTLDAETGTYRDSTLDDLWTMMRVVDASPNIHYGLRPLVARDMPDDLALDLNTAFACTAATAKPIGISFTSAATVAPVIEMFDTALGHPFRRQPFCFAAIAHVVPPLRFSPDGCEVLIEAVRSGMIVQPVSAGQAGATSPASLAGSLAQGLAENLAGVVLVQAVEPGHPAIWAFMPFISDLRSGAMTGGSGEAAVISAAAAQLLNALDLPSTVSAGITDSKVADTQAGYEKGYTVALAAHAGASMVQLSVGMLGSIMVASPESLVIDDEMCGAILRSVEGVDTDAAHLDLDVIESVVTGDGHYLGHPQTLELMRTEFVYPRLADRSSVDEWVTAGSPSVWDRSRERVAEIMAAGRPGHLSPAAEARVRNAFDIRLGD